MSDCLRLELDGEGARQSEIDARSLLEFGGAFISALEEVARAGGVSLTHKGLEVVDKCVELRFQSENLKEAIASALELQRIAMGVTPIPPRTKTHIQRYQRALREQEKAKRTAHVHFGERSFQLHAKKQDAPETPWATTTIRVTVLEVGGEDPHVKVVSESEPAPFELTATKDECLRLREFLYGFVDLTARVLRDIDGDISRGEVVEILQLGAPTAPGPFVDWVKKAGAHWRGANWRKELGRGD